MPFITVPCATCSGTGWATHEDRHTETNRDVCTTCGGTGHVPARPGESRETSWPFAVSGAQQPGPEIVRHKKTSSLYEVLFRGAQIHTDAPLGDDAPVTVCRRLLDGKIVVQFGATPRSVFEVLHHSRLQTDVPLHVLAEVVVYRSVPGGCVWVRPTSEMDDGRFETAPGAHPAGAISILEERTQAAVRYFRDGAAVRTGVLPDHASHIADVLQSLLSDPVLPRAAEPVSDALTQASRIAAGLAEERFRGDLAALFLSGAGDDHPWVMTALRGLQAAQGESYQGRVYRHFQYVAGDDPTDLPERRDRANEEFAELMQALGGTLEGWNAIGRYVWGRPIGDPGQEMGGTLNTLAALAAWAGLDMMACAEAELARTMRPEIIAKIRHKRANRHGRGVLPGDDADLVTSAAEAGR